MAQALTGISFFGIRETAIYSNINTISGDDQPMVAYQLRLLAWDCEDADLRRLQKKVERPFAALFEQDPVLHHRKVTIDESRKWLFEFAAQPVSEYVLISMHGALVVIRAHRRLRKWVRAPQRVESRKGVKPLSRIL